LASTIGDPFMVGLIAPCEVVSRVPACARFDKAGFSPTPSGQGAAALLMLGFAAGLLGFFASCIAALGCCLGPRMLRFRFAVALLALIFSGAGAVVGGAFLRAPGGTLADVIKSHFSWVGSGLGVAIAGTVLQFFALAVVAGTCCCQPPRKAPLAAGKEPSEGATPKGGKKGGKGKSPAAAAAAAEEEEEAAGTGAAGAAEEGKATLNPLSAKKAAAEAGKEGSGSGGPAAPLKEAGGGEGADAAAASPSPKPEHPLKEAGALDSARGTYERAKADFDEVEKEELKGACRALGLDGASTKKAAFALLELHFKAAPATPVVAATAAAAAAVATAAAKEQQGEVAAMK